MTVPEPLRSPGRPRGGDSDCRDRLLAAAMSAFAVVDEAAGHMRAAHAEIAAKLYAPGVSAAQRLRLGVEFLFDQIASDPRLASLVLREATGEGERAACVEERLIRPNLAFYRPLWEEAMREGVFGESDPVVAHAAMIGAIALLVSSRASIARLVGGEMDLARLREEFCRGVFGRGR